MISVTENYQKPPKVHELCSRKSSLAHGRDHKHPPSQRSWPRSQVAGLVNLALGHGRQVEFHERLRPSFFYSLVSVRGSLPFPTRAGSFIRPRNGLQRIFARPPLAIGPDGTLGPWLLELLDGDRALTHSQSFGPENPKI